MEIILVHFLCFPDNFRLRFRSPLVSKRYQKGWKKKKKKRTIVLYYWRELPRVYILSRQTFCRDKHVFVATKCVFCHDKSMLVKYVCRDKYLSLSRQKKFLSRQAVFCRGKRFVATKMILVAALANDSSWSQGSTDSRGQVVCGLNKDR